MMETDTQSGRSSPRSTLRRLFGRGRGDDGEMEEEIRSILDEAHESGVLEKEEADMMQNILEFSDTDAREVMTHRKNISAIDAETPLREAVQFMLSESYSRYPLIGEDLDDILGIVHFKDAVKYLMDHPEDKDRPVGEIGTLLREAAFIQETRQINEIFRYMRRMKEHMAVVIDEYGQTSGIVTMEDILEEIVGSILDEHDADENFIQRRLDNSLVMDGLTPLEEAGRELGYEFPEGEYETLNGYLTQILDRVPTKNDKTVRDGRFVYRILAIENNVIKKVRVDRIPG
ncbi:MAG: HlyC/CorC family transporter [Lachnospiraceae bacterium]|nr:HlyC/CorC family transporter [Lachnospiraceae bacterium]